MIIIVFTHDYKLVLSGVEVLKEFYKIPWKIAQKHIEKSAGREKLSWGKVEEYKVEVEGLPKKEVVGWFR